MRHTIISKILFVSTVVILLIGCGQKQEEFSEPTIQAPSSTETEVATVVETDPIVNEEPIITEEVYNNEIIEKSDTIAEEETVISENEAPQVADFEIIETDETTMYAKSTVNIRSLPSTEGEQLGQLQTAQAVQVTGYVKKYKGEQVLWYKLKDIDGFVNGAYLLTKEPTTTSKSTSTSTSEQKQQPAQQEVQQSEPLIIDQSPTYDEYPDIVGTPDPLADSRVELVDGQFSHNNTDVQLQ